MAGGRGRIRKHESGGGGRYGAYVQDDVEQLPQIEMLRSSYIPVFKCTMCARCCAGKVISLFDMDVRRLGEYAESCTEQMDEEEMALTGAERKMKMADGKCAFLNFCVKITQECDCLAKDDPRIAPDIGIFASLDPVSIDKACLDMVNKAVKKDIFRKLHPKRDGMKQLIHAQDLGLGSLEYDLLVV